MQNTFSQSGNDSKWFLKKSFFKIGKWHSRPPRDPPPFMARAILNFHFDYLTPSLSTCFRFFAFFLTYYIKFFSWFIKYTFFCQTCLIWCPPQKFQQQILMKNFGASVIIPTDQAHCHTDTKTCADICSAPEKKIILARTGTPLLPQTKSNLENDISSFQNLSK